jgi:chorismate mutase
MISAPLIEHKPIGDPQREEKMVASAKIAILVPTHNEEVVIDRSLGL